MDLPHNVLGVGGLAKCDGSSWGLDHETELSSPEIHKLSQDDACLHLKPWPCDFA